MRNRFDDAVFIQNGACNPVAISGTIHKHCLEMLHSGMGMDTIRQDAAMRLMVHQLAFLFRIDFFDSIPGEYSDAVKLVTSESRRLTEGGAA